MKALFFVRHIFLHQNRMLEQIKNISFIIFSEVVSMITDMLSDY